MNQPILIGIASGLLQFGLAGYAFRFARHLGKPVIGWSLFIALSLIALCTPMLSAKLYFDHVASALELNLLNATFSAFLFLGLVRFDRSLRKYRRPDPRWSKNSRGSSAEEAVEELTKTNEQLRQRAGGLERELSEQVEAQKRLESAYKELIISIGTRMPATVESAQPEIEAQPAANQSTPEPQPETAPQPAVNPEPVMTSQPLIAAQPEMPPQEAAPALTSQPVIHLQPEPAPQLEFEAHVEPVPQTETASEPEHPQQEPNSHPQESLKHQEIAVLVNNVTVSVASLAEHLVRCKAASSKLSQLAKLMSTHSRNPGGFKTSNPGSRQLPASLSQLTKQLADEQSLLASQIASIKKRLTQINAALTAVPQIVSDAASPSSASTVTEAEQFHYSLHAGPTETGVSTETEPQQSESLQTETSTMDGELDEANADIQDGGDTGVFIKF
jgi:hypothetical protein